MPSRPCSKCGGTRWLCEAHRDRPWRECNCGDAGMPCDRSNPAGGLDDPPSPPKGFRVDIIDMDRKRGSVTELVKSQVCCYRHIYLQAGNVAAAPAWLSSERRKETMTPQRQRGPRFSNRFLLWSAIGSLAIGLAPIVANILAHEVASRLDCYIAEFSIYSRSGTFDDFSDDVPGCRWGSHDFGSLLVVGSTFGLAFALTWPLVLLSLVLWIVLLVRRLKRPAVSDQ